MTYYGPKDLARSFQTVRNNTLTIAEDIPEDKYDFRPADGARSVRELFAHILMMSRGTYGGHVVRKVTDFNGLDLQSIIKQRIAEEQRYATQSKAELIDGLRKDGEEWIKYFEQAPEGDLAAMVIFPPGAQPPSKSRFEVFLSNKEHEMHHRAQLMLIERMLGIVPHLTRERQARMSGS